MNIAAHTKWNNERKSGGGKSKRRIDSEENKKKGTRRPVPRLHETEEEAIIRRFHDAQRMARFRAKRKKAMEEAARACLNANNNNNNNNNYNNHNTGNSEIPNFANCELISELKRRNVVFQIIPKKTADTEKVEKNRQCCSNNNPTKVTSAAENKYSKLLTIIEELGKDIRLSYAGSRSSTERLKIGIVQAKSLVKDCILQTEINVKAK